MKLILFKVVKELNVGIATAVEILEKGGFKIENKPTTEVPFEAYYYLAHQLGVKPTLLLPVPEKEEEITSFKLLAEIRNKKGVPKSVFKYFPRNDLSIKSLKENYLYHSIFTGFNDPFDCNLNLINFKKGKTPYTGTKSKFLSQFNRTGICCFTSEKNSILMWSHYASHHSGFCLEFLSNKRPNGINPLNVVYKKKFKTADYHKQKEDSSVHLIYSKSECWEYENELRTFITDINNDNERQVPFDRNDLLSVYLGVKCPPDYENEIKVILKEVYENKVKLFRGKLSNDAFEILWDEIELLP